MRKNLLFDGESAAAGFNLISDFYGWFKDNDGDYDTGAERTGHPMCPSGKQMAGWNITQNNMFTFILDCKAYCCNI